MDGKKTTERGWEQKGRRRRKKKEEGGRKRKELPVHCETAYEVLG